MGLDQYAYSRLPDQSPDGVEPKFIWRKHAKLQEFMERLFVARTGQNAAELNCAELELRAEDVATLQAMVERQDMPESPGGFFYGHQMQGAQAEAYRETDLEFCEWARTVLKTRERVWAPPVQG